MGCGYQEVPGCIHILLASRQTDDVGSRRRCPPAWQVTVAPRVEGRCRILQSGTWHRAWYPRPRTVRPVRKKVLFRPSHDRLHANIDASARLGEEMVTLLRGIAGNYAQRKPRRRGNAGNYA